MRVTVFHTSEGGPEPEVTAVPAWEHMDEHEGRVLEGVDLASLLELPGGGAELYHFSPGGSFVMHASPDVAFCQIVRGKGMLGLPDGHTSPYEGPEHYVFLPDTLHEWHTISEETLLSLCIVEQR